VNSVAPPAIDTAALKDAERIVRAVMALILLTAGTSKFFSHGSFAAYYSGLFQGDLRIRLPAPLVNAYLQAIPFIEIGLGCALLSHRHKLLAVHGWFGFMASLLIGHYILQEWSAVNQMLDYFFLGLLCLVLPSHGSWFRRDAPCAHGHPTR
jgi:uncharacterized membrane protein YphA (DoxX/SURF4 family)